MIIGCKQNTNYGRPCKVCGLPTGIAITLGSSNDDGTAICQSCYKSVYVSDKEKLIEKLKELKSVCSEETQLELIKQIETCL